jgi:hypothetical protein
VLASSLCFSVGDEDLVACFCFPGRFVVLGVSGFFFGFLLGFGCCRNYVVLTSFLSLSEARAGR